MEAIQQRLAKLTVDELRTQVKTCGQKPIPITKTTRTLVERRIAKYLWEQQGGGEKEEAEEENSHSKVKTKDDVTDGVSMKSVTEPNSAAASSQRESNKSQADVSTACNEQPSQTKFAREAVVEYFAVCIPPKSEMSSSGGDEVDSSSIGSSDEILIFQDRREALCIAKKNKGARFKVFKTKEEADNFAKSHQDLSTPKPSTEPTTSQPMTEKPMSNFRSIKTQDLVSLRKTIESNNVTRFKELTWSNPRYLINAGDTPTIMQEGSRYNALHIAAKENRLDICRLLLETIEDSNFILLMYPDDPEDTIASRRAYLTDLYLNSPDKGNAETPLHFASKFGNMEITEILVDHPQCDKTLKNKYGQTASEIVCSWSDLSGKALKQLETTIKDLLHDHYYVPVYRSDDNCTQPVIGEPWSPDLSESQSSPLYHARPAAESPIDSALSLQAFAGPMSPAEAECFRRHLKTPPSTERKRVGRIKRADEEKGVERIGRDLASKMKVSWAEYWNFMAAFVDIASPNGLQKFEEYLAESCTVVIEELITRVPIVERAQAQSSAESNGKDGEDVTDSAKMARTGADKKDQLNCTGTNTEKVDQNLKVVKCEQEKGTLPQIVSESHRASNASSETVMQGGNTNHVVNCQGTNTRTKEGTSAKKEMVDYIQDGRPATCVELDKMAGNSLQELSVSHQPGDSLSETVERMGVTGASSNLQKHPPDDVTQKSDTDSNERGIKSLKTRSQSEISLQPADLQANNVTIEENTDTELVPRDNIHLSTGMTCTNCAPTENSSTAESCGSKEGQGSSSTNEHGALQGDRAQPRTVQEDNLSSETENLASGDQWKDEERMMSSVMGNGDRKAELFKTPKAFSAHRTDSNIQSGGREKISFILGPQPTKTDLHVWRALAEVEVPDNYPCIRQWKQLVSSVPGETRDRWPTPARCVPTRVPYSHVSQTPSPCRLRAGFSALLDGSPLGLRARHFSEPTHRSREPASGLRLRQAVFDGAESLGDLKARLFPE